MTLHDRVMNEGAFSDALRSAFDAPPEHGGPPVKKNKKRKSLLRVVPKALAKTAKIIIKPVTSDVTLFGRVFTEGKFGDFARKYIANPYNKVMRTAEKWSDQGGALGGGETDTKTKSTSETKSPFKISVSPKASSADPTSAKDAMRSLTRDTRVARRERTRSLRAGAGLHGGQSQAGTAASVSTRRRRDGQQLQRSRTPRSTSIW